MKRIYREIDVKRRLLYSLGFFGILYILLFFFMACEGRLPESPEEWGLTFLPFGLYFVVALCRPLYDICSYVSYDSSTLYVHSLLFTKKISFENIVSIIFEYEDDGVLNFNTGKYYSFRKPLWRLCYKEGEKMSENQMKLPLPVVGDKYYYDNMPLFDAIKVVNPDFSRM